MSDKPNLAKQYFVDKTIQEAEFVLQRIDKRWPGELTAANVDEATSSLARSLGSGNG